MNLDKPYTPTDSKKDDLRTFKELVSYYENQIQRCDENIGKLEDSDIRKEAWRELKKLCEKNLARCRDKLRESLSI